MSEGNLIEQRYTSAGKKMSGKDGSFVHRFRLAFGLGVALGMRNIKAQYRQSLLGLVWAFLPPIATSVIWIFLTSQGVIKVQDAGIPYPLFVLTGTTLWQLFVQSLMAPLKSVNGNKSILTKINFPREAVLISGLVELLVPLVAGLIVITSAMVFFGQVPDLRLLPGLGMLFLFMVGGLALGLFLLPVGILYKDVQFGLPALLQLLMYLTPVVYPKLLFDGIGSVLNYNPLAPVITAARAWIVNMSDAQPLWHLVATLGAVLVLLLIGLALFRIAMSVLIERMGS